METHGLHVELSETKTEASQKTEAPREGLQGVRGDERTTTTILLSLTSSIDM